jgi:predicted MFS family arabinose efflux permease
VGSLIGGFAAEWRGIDGLLAGTVAVLAVALLPLSWLRQSEHQLELEHPELAPEDRHKHEGSS